MILPRKTLDSLNLQVGDQLQVIETDDGIVVSPVGSDDVQRQMRVARDVMDKYQTALQRLTK
ncbi:AbrB/MazE/SpoVT family DNA-binding domain-containing protein [Mesorhizobium sp.]|uniref:AbrB/MazE/SpoVT family DNA-binding domain-containing protein n=1 Tax=Mesorhizobium sp. TaxID=1871066 RepID=UPI00356971A8